MFIIDFLTIEDDPLQKLEEEQTAVVPFSRSLK